MSGDDSSGAGGAEARRSRRFGWTSLAVWATAGVGLETAHGFKLAVYLDDEVARLLLRLAHAHGVGLSLVVLVYSVAGAPLLASTSDGGRRVGAALRVAAVGLPAGFLAGAIGHPEGDPSVGVLLVPLAALALLWALARLAIAAFRSPPR